MKHYLYLLIILLFPFIFNNCNNNSERNKSIELTNKASEIYARIVVPLTIEDSDKINEALKLLNKAICIDSLNVSAYVNKQNILFGIGKYYEGLSILKHIRLIDENYDNYMLEGFVYVKLDSLEKSNMAFKKSLHICDSLIQHSDNKELIQKRVLLITILYGIDAGLQEINKYIIKDNNTYFRMLKENVITDFELNKFIDESIFIKSKQLN